MTQLIDTFNRKHNYLRISVTDRCNFRCQYCMPPEGIKLQPRSEILTFDEIFRIAKILSDLGVDKIRLTGGEPLARKDLEVLIQRFSTLHNINTIGMTTNGYFLKEISEEAFKQQREAETGERIVVGVNQFQSDTEEDIRLHQSNPKGVKIQKEKLKKLRKQRDNQRLKGILNSLKRSAEEGENLMPILSDAVKAYGTVGEICDVLRTVYGEYKESRVFI